MCTSCLTYLINANENLAELLARKVHDFPLYMRIIQQYCIKSKEITTFVAREFVAGGNSLSNGSVNENNIEIFKILVENDFSLEVLSAAVIKEIMSDVSK